MSSSNLPKLVQLTASTQDESTRIDILDGELKLVPGSSQLGETSVQVPPGVYAVRFQIGSAYIQRVAILPPDSSGVHIFLNDLDAPQFATSAPVSRTRSTHEFQQEPATRLSRAPPVVRGATGAGPVSHLLVFTRELIPSKGTGAILQLSLWTCEGVHVCDFADDAERDPVHGWAGCHYALTPGAYRLRLAAGPNDFVEQIVYVVAGWQTQVFLLLPPAASSDPRPQAGLRNVSILMTKPEKGFDPDRQDSRWAESALRALAGTGNVPGAVRTEMMWQKFQNPMLGIYAGLLHLRRAQIDPQLMREVFHNLMALVGPLPDVLAIGWGLALRDETTRNDALFMQSLERPGDLSTPPMLRASWDLVVEASVSHEKVVPAGSLAARAAARMTNSGPWCAWRGELPQATAIESPGFDPNSSIWIQLAMPIVDAVTAVTLPVALVLLTRTLESTGAPAGILLHSRRYNNTERRLALYVYPLLDPQLQSLAKDDKELLNQIRRSMVARRGDSTALVRSLGIPMTLAMSAAWSLVRKLWLQPVVPHNALLTQFISSESHDNATLIELLNRLRDEPTSLHHRRGGEPVKALAVIFLYYRGSPAAHEGARGINETLGLLAENEYVAENDDADTLSKYIDEVIARARSSLIVQLADAVSKQRIELADGWQSDVLPPPGAYTKGALLPVADVLPAPDAYTKGTLLPIPKGSQTVTAPASTRTAASRPTRIDAWRRNWRIVRADADIAHVMLPLADFTLQNTSDSSGMPAYVLVHNVHAPTNDFFAGALLRPAGQEERNFFEITGIEQLPVYSQDTDELYTRVSETMGTFLQRETSVQRLEGVIRILRHAPCTPSAAGTRTNHAPLSVETPVQFFQFNHVVDGDLPLLVVHTPLSPACPMNGSGIALGVGR